jgi:hypothetical protein
MKDNKHVQAIPSTVLTQAQTKVQELAALLAPYLLALTPADGPKRAAPAKLNRTRRTERGTAGI